MPLPRRLRSFSLRTLMALVTMASIGLAVLSRDSIARRSALRNWLRTGAAEVTIAGDSAAGWVPNPVPWHRRLLGDRDVLSIRFYAPAHDEIKLAERLFPEADVGQWFDGHTRSSKVPSFLTPLPLWVP